MSKLSTFFLSEWVSQGGAGTRKWKKFWKRGDAITITSEAVGQVVGEGKRGNFYGRDKKRKKKISERGKENHVGGGSCRKGTLGKARRLFVDF